MEQAAEIISTIDLPQTQKSWSADIKGRAVHASPQTGKLSASSSGIASTESYLLQNGLSIGLSRRSNSAKRFEAVLLKEDCGVVGGTRAYKEMEKLLGAVGKLREKERISRGEK